MQDFLPKIRGFTPINGELLAKKLRGTSTAASVACNFLAENYKSYSQNKKAPTALTVLDKVLYCRNAENRDRNH